MSHHPLRPPPSVLRTLLTNEASGGLVLIAAAIAAIVLANSGAAGLYHTTLATKVLGLSVLHWINDALMTLFFVMVGLEIKRELLDGHLARWSHRVLPGIALHHVIRVMLGIPRQGALRARSESETHA